MAAIFQAVSPSILLFALVGGVLPAVLWLLFWLREDARHPEPRSLIIGTFFAGAFVVIIALPAEQYSIRLLGGSITVLVLLAWAFIEELLKYLAALGTSFRSHAFDEPVDAMIYLITAALGFAALENTLFILKDLLEESSTIGILTASMRSVGATLLHVAAAAVIGGCVALAFYRSWPLKIIAAISGVLLATALHLAFNHLIMLGGGEHTFLVFGALWVLIIGIILFFEKVKHLTRPKIDI